MTIEEIWKDVEGYEECYQVSNLGRIRSLDRKVNCKGGYAIKHGKILKQYKLICPKHEKPFRYFCNDCKVHECKECRKENLSMKKCIHINYIDFAQKEYDIKNQIKEINEKIESSNICDKSLNESDFNLKNSDYIDNFRQFTENLINTYF